MPTSGIDLQAALSFVCDLARDAGDIARKHRRPDLAFDAKQHNSPVTAADTEINTLVIERCRAAYPDIGVLGEEDSSTGISDLLWVCDPIDGTIPYMLGMQASTFCLALVHDGEPVLGVVYDFSNDRLYSAIKGEGAWVNETILRTAPAPLKLVELETYPGAACDVGDLHKRLIAAGWQSPNFASVSFVSMAVAMGRVSGAIYAGDKAWDIAAAKVIVEECGGKVLSLDGREQRYDGLISGAVVVHPKHADEIVAIVAKARP